MAKKLIWSKNAVISRNEILSYWNKRNKSKVYSRKLNQLFEEATQQILNFSFSGIEISGEYYRAILIKDYYLIYAAKNDIIEILLFWDTRQNPDKLSEILGL